jgi:hypothetical protein
LNARFYSLVLAQVHQGVNLLGVPWNCNNINLHGTKLADKLFSKAELSKGMFEPGRGFDPKRVALDQNKINIIKACYLKKVI